MKNEWKGKKKGKVKTKPKQQETFAHQADDLQSMSGVLPSRDLKKNLGCG